jgi:hypothetical protein
VPVCLTVFVSMVHCRTPFGAWKHANRSYKRGYAARPPDFYGGDLLPPPAPPFSFGVEFSGNRHSDWNVLCDESEEWGTLERNCPTDRNCPTGDVTDVLELLDVPIAVKDFSLEKARPTGTVSFFVDAPLSAKDISIPTTLCLSILLEHNATKARGVSTELKEAAITGDGFILEQPPTSADYITGEFLDQPSTNGIISEDRLALLDLVGKRET